MTNAYTRRNTILSLLEEHGSVHVEELTAKFNVSAVTIRSDLSHIEKQHANIVRFHGGAVLEDRKMPTEEISVELKSQLNHDIKSRISKIAATLVEDNDSILLDNGSTIDLFAQEIKGKKNLFVMTNSLEAAYQLKNIETIDLMVIGGYVRKKSNSMCGQIAEQYIDAHRFSKLFLGVDGFDLEVGITTPNRDEAEINRAMCKVAKEIIVLVDSSKFGKTSYCSICELSAVSKVVTDNNIPHYYYEALVDRGIEVIIAE